uniref:Protein kinase domain-containing protein n=1 Tax=Oryza glumipatula TaxID=40148 RepID=A0A0E0AX76_9ORYZ
MGGPYLLQWSNNVALVGCDTQVDLRGADQENTLISSCTAICPSDGQDGGTIVGAGGTGTCLGIGCCQATIVSGHASYGVQIHVLNGSSYSGRNSDYVYIVDQVFNYTLDMAFETSLPEALPAMLDWLISTNNSSCTSTGSAPECRSAHSFCQNYDHFSSNPSGYQCHCSKGYEGNPYVPGGCNDIDECKQPEKYSCYGGFCNNTHGNFDCQCSNGTIGDPFRKGGCIPITVMVNGPSKGFPGSSIGLVVGGCSVLLLLVLVAPFMIRKELEKATDNFDKTREVGNGGHGVVFKGILDLHVVAIKKSKIVVQREIDEFINELLGCCLETEVPLLVYEFISNGTLYQHLHVEGPVSLSWNNRLRIALEVAHALSYLHSAASMPIFHRDIKSSNILLDNNLTAKISDFGASRYIPMDQTGITTVVQGTMGYLDPMYYYTGRLTDKSDVFSFGVLLVELLTRKKPIVYRFGDGDSLVSHFISLFKSHDVADIIDPQVMEEESGEVSEVAALAAICTKLKASERPSMREVEMALEYLVQKRGCGHGFDLISKLPISIGIVGSIICCSYHIHTEMVRMVVSSRRVHAQLLILQLLAAVVAAADELAVPPAKKIKSCTTRCGNISIEYPFGVEPGCYHAVGFNLTCDHSYHPPRLFLGDGTVLDISIPNGTVRINSGRINLKNNDRGSANGTWGGGLPDGGPFFLSESESSLLLMGCDSQVVVRELGGNHTLLASCSVICPSLSLQRGFFQIFRTSACSGIGCCQTNIIFGYSTYLIQNHKVDQSLDASYSEIYLVDQGFNPNSDEDPQALPALLEWVISKSTSNCPRNSSASECRSAHSSCRDTDAWAHKGYRCECSDGYQGNPYIIDGCKVTRKEDIIVGAKMASRATLLSQTDAKTQRCIHAMESAEIRVGHFIVNVKMEHMGIPLKRGCITSKNSLTARVVKQRRDKKLKEKFFKQNHGLLLQQLISKNTDFGERMIITLEELQKATNNFDRSRQVGDGGHGVVFKGILDLNVVAIKKSKIIVQREIGEFINEVAILSQINHRNVVKLLGCCLETEVPLLVYEFISHGTLYHHLHIDGPISLSWGDRLRISLEVARALSYLHSASSMPIYHRDIKSSNILLDDSLTAKVSDFGASKYTPIDRSEITTAVQGTIGYLDPMYYYIGRLTDKSDVFSFGVVLVELLTRKKPVADTFDGDSLVSHFVSLLSEGNLINIIDPQVKEEEDGEVHEVAALAALCTKLKGEERPSMREVEMALENILSKKGPFHKGNRESSRPSKNQISALYMSIEGVATEAIYQLGNNKTEANLTDRVGTSYN